MQLTGLQSLPATPAPQTLSSWAQRNLCAVDPEETFCALDLTAVSRKPFSPGRSGTGLLMEGEADSEMCRFANTG